MTDSASFSNVHGTPIDFTSFKRVDWKNLPVSQHPVERSKFAKIQPPFLIPGQGYFILFKACNEEGKIKNGTHEFVECISKQGYFQCSFHKKSSDCIANNYSHSCVRVEFNPNSVVQHFLGKQVDEK
jgi:hypothetical protein